MKHLTIVRNIAFVALVIVGTSPTAEVLGLAADTCIVCYTDPPGIEECDYCPADWQGSCYTFNGGDCQEFGCNGPFGQCHVASHSDPDPCAGPIADVCSCPECT